MLNVNLEWCLDGEKKCVQSKQEAERPPESGNKKCKFTLSIVHLNP